ncbi:Siderophore iron transporter mirB like [Actinidia chinensis var. chinensis]|uniref:Siderophore iron transporter mirB like n=1 Tax=Actinidia chinensis var. chinensis TaxID=1590841 RepID=A0A2R6PWY8_ACTCC|nr:Siderophore iron transporter mirB like [Actinidia chinensis var. chinensis]
MAEAKDILLSSNSSSSDPDDAKSTEMAEDNLSYVSKNRSSSSSSPKPSQFIVIVFRRSIVGPFLWSWWSIVGPFSVVWFITLVNTNQIIENLVSCVFYLIFFS